MKINIRDFETRTYSVEIEPVDSILMLKEKIFEVLGHEYPVRQTLIYDGKIMSDQHIVKDYNISKDKYVLVLLNDEITASILKPSSSSSSSIDENSD
ncbi:UV excision repair protein RAD23 homolog A-like [Teleopsis dalmanni]|uniref:UV excision repair protein RAD23 homolog A-like n=1 Tax=Teleopsis dalmanni TaxID=139649 RepID=UPI0018CCEABF|nr:UV excision repair protein RAD23 homolog A-like [Teleopsis dalmanni]XP_037942237.1 UV excision repair protein RAD23 homolog A-like [Teleopsis dalmanni]